MFNDELQEYLILLNEINYTELNKVRDEILYIINNNIIDENIIEHIFDRLLDLVYWYGDELNELYFKFLDYYKIINNEASKDYKLHYLEICNKE